MNEDLLEIEFAELSDHFGCKIETVRKTYNELLSKNCVNNGGEDQLLDCLYEALLEKTMSISRTESFMVGDTYASTNDYALNKSLAEVYGEDAIDDLSDAYIYYSTADDDYEINDYINRHTI